MTALNTIGLFKLPLKNNMLYVLIFIFIFLFSLVTMHFYSEEYNLNDFIYLILLYSMNAYIITVLVYNISQNKIDPNNINIGVPNFSLFNKNKFM